MPDRISVGRIVYGHGDTQGVVEPGQRFNSEDVGITPEVLARMDEQHLVQKVHNPTDAHVAPSGPTRAASEAAPEPIGEKLPELVDRDTDASVKPVSHSSPRRRKDEFDDV